MFELVRPDCLDDDQWVAIDDHRDRMERALRDRDLSLLIGSAKELCETCAKLVWVFSGQQFASAADMR